MRICVVAVAIVCLFLSSPALSQKVSGNFANGSVRVGNDTGACDSARYGAIRFNTNKFQGCSTGGWVDIGTFGGSSSVWADGGAGKIYYNGGYVGIGTQSPLSELDVKGGLTLSNGGGAALQISSTYSTGPISHTVNVSLLGSNSDLFIDAPSAFFTGSVDASGFSGSGSFLTNLNASALSTGTVPAARLGSGTPNSTTYLRGDGTWAAPSVIEADPQVGTTTAGNFCLANAGGTAIDCATASVDLASQVTGNLAVARLNGGTAASTATFWRGDGSWSSTIAGNLTATAYLHSSDARLKKDVETIKDPMALLAALRGVRYKWRENDKPSYGFIAQEVEKVAADVVVTDENGMKAIEYDQFIAPLVEAVKAQQADIDALKREIRELREQSAE